MTIQNWQLLYVGVMQGYVGAEEAVEMLSPEAWKKLKDDEIAEVYIGLENSREQFLSTVQRLFPLTNEDLQQNDFIWSIHFLEEVSASNLDVSQKLKKIAVLWAMFDYPEDWRDFIHYLPAKPGRRQSTDSVYEVFADYLSRSKAEIQRVGLKVP